MQALSQTVACSGPCISPRSKEASVFAEYLPVLFFWGAIAAGLAVPVGAILAVMWLIRRYDGE